MAPFRHSGVIKNAIFFSQPYGRLILVFSHSACGLVPFEEMHGSFHNHTLTQTQSQANAAPGGKQRQIPADLRIIGAAMADVHQRAGSIYDILARMCKKAFSA